MSGSVVASPRNQNKRMPCFGIQSRPPKGGFFVGRIDRNIDHARDLIAALDRPDTEASISNREMSSASVHVPYLSEPRARFRPSCDTGRPGLGGMRFARGLQVRQFRCDARGIDVGVQTVGPQRGASLSSTHPGARSSNIFGLKGSWRRSYDRLWRFVGHVRCARSGNRQPRKKRPIGDCKTRRDDRTC